MHPPLFFRGCTSFETLPSLRAGSPLAYMREMRDVTGEATRRAAKPRGPSRRRHSRLASRTYNPNESLLAG